MVGAGFDRVGETADMRSEIGFDRHEKTLARVDWILPNRPGGAGRCDERLVARHAVDGVAIFLAKLADNEHRDVALAGERGESEKKSSNVGVGAAEVRAERIDDDQSAIGQGVEKTPQSGKVAVAGEAAGDFVGILAGDCGDTEDAVAIGAERFEAGANGVGEVVFGGEEEDGRGGGWERGRRGGLRLRAEGSSPSPLLPLSPS